MLTALQFQSSPGFEAGRYYVMPGFEQIDSAVFQSSPGFEAGRYFYSGARQSPYVDSSNPRPVLRPGATCRQVMDIGGTNLVPILARF